MIVGSGKHAVEQWPNVPAAINDSVLVLFGGVAKAKLAFCKVLEKVALSRRGRFLAFRPLQAAEFSHKSRT